LKKAHLSFVILAVAISLLIGCQSKTKEPYMFFKDDQENTLLTDLDLRAMNVMSLLDTGGRGFYIELANDNKLEEITEQNLNRTIRIYYRDELLSSSRIEHVIKGNNLVFNDMDEEALTRLENLLLKNK